jgi:hypothetical protein
MNYILLSTTSNLSDNKTKITVAIIAAAVSLFTSFIVTFINNKRQRKSTYINTITSNRIDWMKELKIHINDFICMTTLGNYTAVYNTIEKKTEFFDDLNHIKNRIYLHLNFKGYIDEKILAIIKEISDRIEIIYELDEIIKIKSHEKKLTYVFDNFDEEVFMDIMNEFGGEKEKVKELVMKYYLGEEFPEEFAKSINEYIRKFNKKLQGIPRKLIEEIEEYHNELLMYAQIYLKLEWNRVKDESNGEFNTYSNEDEYMIEVSECERNYKYKLTNYNMKKLVEYMKND